MDNNKRASQADLILRVVVEPTPLRLTKSYASSWWFDAEPVLVCRVSCLSQTGEVIINNYRLVQALGKGSYGEVFQAEMHGEFFAIKCISKKRLTRKFRLQPTLFIILLTHFA